MINVSGIVKTTLLQAARSFVNCSISSVDRFVHFRRSHSMLFVVYISPNFNLYFSWCVPDIWASLQQLNSTTFLTILLQYLFRLLSVHGMCRRRLSSLTSKGLFPISFPSLPVFLPSPSPGPSLPSATAIVRLSFHPCPAVTRVPGECCKLPHWGLGRNPRRRQFWFWER